MLRIDLECLPIFGHRLFFLARIPERCSEIGAHVRAVRLRRKRLLKPLDGFVESSQVEEEIGVFRHQRRIVRILNQSLFEHGEQLFVIHFRMVLGQVRALRPGSGPRHRALDLIERQNVAGSSSEDDSEDREMDIA